MYILLLDLINYVFVVTETEEYNKTVKEEPSINEFLIPVIKSDNLIHLKLISEINTLSN